MRGTSFLVSIIAISLVAYFHTAFGQIPMCDSEKCYGIKLQDCKKKSESTNKVFYNDKSFKCEVTTKCHKGEYEDGDRVHEGFENIGECETSCSFCQKLLKFYKPEDPCLLGSVEISSDTKKPAKKQTFWRFVQQHGKCTTFTSELADGFHATKGVIFKTEAECTKQCPPIPANS